MARRFFQPVTVVAVSRRGRCDPVHGRQRHGRSRPGRAGTGSHRAGRAPPCARVVRVPVGTDAAAALAQVAGRRCRAGRVLGWAWWASNGCRARRRSPRPAQGARPARPQADTGHPGGRACREGQISAGALAFFVTLEADRPGRFSTNAVPVLPVEDAEIDFVPRDRRPPRRPVHRPRPSFRNHCLLTSGDAAVTAFSYQLYSSATFPRSPTRWRC